MSISELALAGLEQALNQHIAMDPKAQTQMAQLHGRVIALEIMGTSQSIYLFPGPEMIQLFGSHAGEPDCLLQGSPMTIARLHSRIPEGDAAIPEEMQISGDRELAEQFCRILRRVEIDWEAQLSQYTGSLIAGEIGKAMEFAGYWRNHIVQTLQQDMQDVLQHEAAVLPKRHEIDGFGADVDRLANQVQQLQHRVAALQHPDDSPGATS